jgi:hypothetical protein
MPKPTCGDCLYFTDGKCSDGGRFFNLSHHRHAGQPRHPNALACKHFCRLGLPECFHVGGIDPRSAAQQYEHATLDELLSALFSTPPDDPETVIERMEAEPYTLEQARAIKTILGELANGDKRIAEVAFKSIREAAEKARWSLQWEYKAGLPKRPYQLMTELARIGERGKLSKKADGVLLNAFLYGAVSASVIEIDCEEYDKAESFNRLRQLSPDDLRRAASAACDAQGMLRGKAGHPESSTVREFIRAVAHEYVTLSGKPGVAWSRNLDNDPSGPLIKLAGLCLEPVHPLKPEGIVPHLRAIRKMQR